MDADFRRDRDSLERRNCHGPHLHAPPLHPHLPRSQLSPDLLDYYRPQRCDFRVRRLSHMPHLPTYHLQFRQNKPKRRVRKFE